MEHERKAHSKHLILTVVNDTKDFNYQFEKFGM